jgi:UDP-N-acetylmuramoyl-L-alanyl-D-glutamate--2,6-diaminopimelate ligase
MKLRDVLQNIDILAGGRPGNEEISGIAYNSKSVGPGFLFAALRGAARNGMDFVAEAEANGAAAVLSTWPKPPASATKRWPWPRPISTGTPPTG